MKPTHVSGITDIRNLLGDGPAAATGRAEGRALWHALAARHDVPEHVLAEAARRFSAAPVP